MALAGTDMIFATSFGYMDPVINVAKKFPGVKFEHATGYKTADNVSTYSARFYEGRSVVGHVAGKMTRTNIVGYVASFPIPEVVRGINSAYLAAKKANPYVKFKIIWIFTWYDPAKEADAAKTLISQGADVVLQHVDSSAIMSVAEEKGVYAFGQASDMSAFGPNAHLTAIINGWAPYYVEKVKQAILLYQKLNKEENVIPSRSKQVKEEHEHAKQSPFKLKDFSPAKTSIQLIDLWPAYALSTALLRTIDDDAQISTPIPSPSIKGIET